MINPVNKDIYIYIHIYMYTPNYMTFYFDTKQTKLYEWNKIIDKASIAGRWFQLTITRPIIHILVIYTHFVSTESLNKTTTFITRNPINSGKKNSAYFVCVCACYRKKENSFLNTACLCIYFYMIQENKNIFNRYI